MTKQEIFDFLDKTINYIDKRLCHANAEECFDAQLRTMEPLPFEYSIDVGISKAVLLIKNTPFVIKIPCFTIFEEESFDDAHYEWSEARDTALAAKGDLSAEGLRAFYRQYEQEHPEPTMDDDQFYYPIGGAQNIDLGGAEDAIDDADYCQLETVIYELAVKEGLGAYFAEEGYLGDIDEIPIYYQTRCTPMNTLNIDYNSKESKEKRSKSKKICEDLQIECFNATWISDFIDVYGIDEFKRLNAFLDRYEIGDLRSCNIGYLDGAPILFDYSGYREW